MALGNGTVYLAGFAAADVAIGSGTADVPHPAVVVIRVSSTLGVASTATLADALRVMTLGQLGLVIVMNGDRLVGLLAYDTKPGTCSTELLRLARYGRTG